VRLNTGRTSQALESSLFSNCITMDPFSISTGVAGFLSLAIELTKIIGGYIGGVKSAPEDAHKLLTEVTSLCYILEKLVRFLRKDYKGNSESTSALVVVIRSCQKEIEDLYKKLEKLQTPNTKVAGIIERIKWPLKMEEYQGTLANLHRFAQTFQFSLTIANWYVSYLLK
jgi:hypothetical protein